MLSAWVLWEERSLFLSQEGIGHDPAGPSELREKAGLCPGGNQRGGGEGEGQAAWEIRTLGVPGPLPAYAVGKPGTFWNI